MAELLPNFDSSTSAALRKKLEDDPNHPKYIRTIYGMGYKFGG